MIETLEPKLRALFDYWDGKRGGRVMPARPDIDPIEIPDLLPHLMLVATADRVEDFRFRLFGTEVTKGFGEDRTGKRIGELTGIENLDEVLNGYWLTYSEKTPQYFQGRTVSSAKDHVQYSRLTLPLSADGERVDMILGGFVFFAAE